MNSGYADPGSDYPIGRQGTVPRPTKLCWPTKILAHKKNFTSLFVLISFLCHKQVFFNILPWPMKWIIRL